MGVAEYEIEITKKLSKALKSSLPTIEEIEAEFAKNEAQAKVGRQKTKPMSKAKTQKPRKGLL